MAIGAPGTVAAQALDIGGTERAEALELGTTTVRSASGFEQNIADAPASISVVSRKELEKQSYSDITDAMKNIPGVYVTGGGGMQDISIRGMTAAYTLYLIDGRPISAGRSVNTNGSDGGKQIALPPLSMIERIEVIRGPMSSLYGSEAMGGVVNIITRKSGNAWHGSLNTEYTRSLNDLSNDGKQVDLFAGGALVPDLLGLQLNGSYVNTVESDYSGGGDSAESTPDSTNKKGGARLYFTPNDQNEFGFSYDSATRRYTHTPGRSVAEDATRSTTRYDKDVYVISHDGNYGDVLLNTYLQHDISDRVQTSTKRERVSILNSQGTWFLGRHTLTFGGQYKNESFVDETNGLLTSNVDGAVKKVDRWLAALYSEIEWGILDNFSVTTGLRYNDDELFGGHLSPRVYGVHHATPELTFKGGVSTGYLQPSLTSATEGFGRGTGGGGSPVPHPRALIIGNSELEPETSTSYEFGYVYDDKALGLNTSLMLFHTEYKDKIAEFRTCETPNSTAVRNDPSAWSCPFGGNNYLFLSTQRNISEAMMQGVEFTLDYALRDDLDFRTSYTFTDSEQKSGDFKGDPLNKVPRHMFNAGLDWDVTEKLGSWVQYNYRGKTSDYLSRVSMSDGTPGYGFVDVGLVYQLTRNIDLKGGLYNVANKEVSNDEYGVVLDGRRLTVGLTVDF
ncbi:ligand-gated channel protein [Pseudomonas matsuisoli]|uniref:Ligand-gated channel protein n=2 Tax=Pseudomonas matsuisoli TaxID=1515666 RepID=A0A917PTH3_9PSED|nr:ligand-gated channel protein [Pseudomonas matsuisoli]